VAKTQGRAPNDFNIDIAAAVIIYEGSCVHIGLRLSFHSFPLVTIILWNRGTSVVVALSPK
jgi:hypothetical protein